jgi:hypothetical protein
MMVRRLARGADCARRRDGEAMSKPFVVVATPCYGGLVNQAYMLSVLKLLQAASSGEFELDVVLLGGDSLITRSRSVLVSRFLDNPSATHLMFVDADIAFEPAQFLRLLRLGKDFATGAYPLKQIDWRQLPKRAIAGEPLAAAGLSYVGQICEGGALRREGGFATAKYAGTGFQLIRRQVFDRMIVAHPELKFTGVHTLTNETPNSDNLYALFECAIDRETGVYLSEDYAFCARWRALGGEIWLDLESKLTHTGMSAYEGDCTGRYATPAQLAVHEGGRQEQRAATG